MAGPILPIIPIGSSAGSQINLIIHITTTSSGVDVEPHGLRVEAPCKLATIAENISFPDPNVVVHSKSNAGFVRLQSDDAVSLLVLLDTANLERCRLSLAGMFARAGLLVPDLTFEERTNVAFDTFP